MNPAFQKALARRLLRPQCCMGSIRAARRAGRAHAARTIAIRATGFFSRTREGGALLMAQCHHRIDANRPAYRKVGGE